MTSTKTQTALDRFVSRTRELFARENDLEKRWTALSPILADLLADGDVVAAAKNWPECKFIDKRVQNLIFYEDPDYKFVINGLVVDNVGYRNIATRIHDHGPIYTLYGLLDGRQRIERYERLDDGSKPDYAEIRTTVDSECGPGEIDLVRPFEIHAEDQLGERSVAIIIRSERSGEFLQGRYFPDRNGYEQSLGPVEVPIPFY
jgi:hypothetical protein